MVLRDVRIHGHRVLDAIVVAVRDDVWGTYPFSPAAGSLGGVHGDVFAWEGRLDVSDDSVHFEMRGRVLRDFSSQRVGICLLHPLSLAGRDFLADGVPGTFGVAVNPAVLASGFHTLSYESVDITFDGPPLEMEDHRNWSDPGWKSYCPPLGAAAPRRWRAGDEVVQSVTVRGRPSAVPSVGAYVTGASGLRHVDVFEDGPPADLGGEEPLSVALIGRTPTWLAAACARIAGRAVRVAVFDPTTHTTAPGSAPLVRDVLRHLGCDTPVGGGSHAHLAELNRLVASGGDVADPNRPAALPREWDFVTFPITAQAHQSDTPSVLATALAQPAMMARARSIAPNLPIVVGPLAFRPRQGANSPAAPGDPPDPREAGPLGATWLLGCVLGLRGAEALTVLLDRSPPTDALLRELDTLAGRPYVDLPTGRPDVLAATVLGDTPVILVANLGPEPFSLDGTVVAGYGSAVFRRVA